MKPLAGKIQTGESLSPIRETATAFLYLDIKDMDFAHMAQHPFTKYWYIGGSQGVMNLRNPENQEIWRQKVSRQIDDAADLIALLSLFQKSYILVFLKHIESFLDDDSWPGCYRIPGAELKR